ncbi:F0F1 ATP synthase subunit A [Verrucomicrobium sp. GAS474]|uniref:F0F1 ATP synthase subunit A n=1 Tax=Verrucomicrobium sp. GAS474 TaxID=1882831 RepID=UPI0012FF6908|nr:F0F1 ATP synthase subunit A [Verrucomicrobium sp. GAS474]
MAPVLFHLGPVGISGSMIVMVVVAAALIAFAQIATRSATLIPTGLQNFAEWVIESLYNFLGDILGAKLVKATFWFFASLFLFILALNWFGLLPGVGTIGRGVGESALDLHITEPFLRGANADLNLPVALSLLFFGLWIFWAVRYNGPVGVIKHIFGSKADFPGIVGFLMAIVFVAVGVLELISILIRPIALSFRLYGNVYGGEVMIDSMMNLANSPFLKWIAPTPFYFYELLVGLVQALVFCLLCSVFTAMMCRHDEEGGSH